MSIHSTLAVNLRHAVEVAGISQRAFAEDADTYAPEINKLLQGKTDPRLSTLEKLSHAIGVPVGDLLGMKPDEFRAAYPKSPIVARPARKRARKSPKRRRAG